MNSGIYIIVNFTTNKFYIGRAINLIHRWSTHRSALNNKKHTNILLQNAWNKYGENDFKFFVIETVIDKKILIEREQFWIDNLNACDKTKAFNINPSAENSLNYKHSEETKLKIKSNTIRLGLKPPSPLGRKHSEETKLKMSLAAKGKPKSEEAKRNMRKPKSESHKLNAAIARRKKK